MFKSIPASNIAAIYPAVLGAGGNPLGLNTNLLSVNQLQPSVQYFSASAVGDVFGLDSDEYKFATIYFNGYKGASARPDSLIITRYQPQGIAAYLLSGSVKDITLEQLKTFSGVFTITINGSEFSDNISLSAATSFSNAAQIIQDAINGEDSVVTVKYDAKVGFYIGVVVEPVIDGTITFASGEFAEQLRFTQALGATTENAGAPDTANTVFARMTTNSTSFSTITYAYPLEDDFKKDLARLLSQQNSRYWFVPYGVEPLATVANNPLSFGGWCIENSISGVTPVYGEIEEAALACAYAASINHEELNGRTTMAFRAQDGISARVTDEQIAEALVSNGYSFYGAWGTANDRFVFMGNGAVTGDFKWVDNYLFQIFLNSQFQLAYMQMVQNFNTIPYNTDGEAIVRAVTGDPIRQGKNFGGIQSGITLTDQQKQAIKVAVGKDVSTQMFVDGYYLYVAQPSAQARANRESFVIKFFYTDGSSMQRIEMTSTNVQ